MPPTFAQFDRVFAEHAQLSCVITPNERLAQEHQRAWDHLQASAGAGGWLRLDCISIRRFFRREWQIASHKAPTTLPLLSNEQLVQIAWDCQPPEGGDLPSFIRAWEAIHDYNINISHASFRTPQRQEFVTWFQAVQRQLDGEWMLEQHIPEQLIRLNLLPDRTLLGDHLDQLTPAQLRYFQWVADHQSIHSRNCAALAAVQQGHTPLPEAPADNIKHTHKPTQIVQCKSLEDELLSAASWASNLVDSNPDITVGIVVPGLATHYAAVTRQIGLGLDPVFGSLSERFDIGGGTALADTPAWEAAKLLGQLFFDEINLIDLQLLRNNPFVQPILAEQIFERLVELPPKVSFQWLKEHASEALTNIEFPAHLTQPATARRLQHWLDGLLELLQCCGWPRLRERGSVQFQYCQALQTKLTQLQAHAPSPRTLAYAETAQLLETALSATQIAPQRKPSQILVVGTLETTGLQFDHVWLCQADEHQFPSAPSPNRYLPPALVRQAGVPRSTPEQEVVLAQRTLQRLFGHSGSFVASYTDVVEESEQQLSPLLQAVIEQHEQAPTHRVVDPSLGLQKLSEQQTNTALQPYNDHRGIPLEVPASGSRTTRGGTTLLGNLAACQFRAYAVHRLGLRPPETVTLLPNALGRGTSLHHCLHQLVSQAPDKAALLQLQPDQIRQIVSKSLSEIAPDLPETFAQNEVQRLYELVCEWLEIEGRRPDFHAASLEQSFPLLVDRLQINVRVDRIDKVADGQLVIDYKTGKQSTPDPETGLEDAPQLFAYALLDDTISGMVYGVVKSGMSDLFGIQADSQAGESRRLTKVQDWQQARSSWRHKLDQLARNHIAGEARVEPRRGACRYCHLSALCRIEDPND